jgi:hypothetical protein
MATHGSEFVTARVATEQIIDLCTALQHLGVPVREKSHMFGDNKSIIDSAAVPRGVLSKHWGHQAIWPLLQALLFWEGGTVDLFDHQKCEQAEHRSKSGLNETEQSNLANVIVEKHDFQNSPHAPRMRVGKFNNEVIMVVRQVDDFAMAGSNGEVTKSFFKEIDRHCAVVVEQEPMKRMHGVNIVQTKWHIQLRMLTCIELMAQEHDRL